MPFAEHDDVIKAFGTLAGDVQVGGYHSCALFSGGQVNCWGFGQDGQLDASSKPTILAFANAWPAPNIPSPAKEIAAGGYPERDGIRAPHLGRRVEVVELHEPLDLLVLQHLAHYRAGIVSTRPGEVADRVPSVPRVAGTSTARRWGKIQVNVTAVTSRAAGVTAAPDAPAGYFVEGELCGDADGGGLTSPTETVTWSPFLMP